MPKIFPLNRLLLTVLPAMILTSCGVVQMAQLNSTKKTVQNLELDTPMPAVLSQLKPSAIIDRETLRMGDAEYKILLVATDREHLFGFEYKALCTPLIFTDDKLIGKTQQMYDLLKSLTRHLELLKRFSKKEADLIIAGRVVIGMSEAAIIEIFNGQPDKTIALKLNTYSTSGSARAYEAWDHLTKYTLYVINGKLAKFVID